MIHVVDLSKTFGRGPGAVVAVEGLHFAVERGEVFGLLGPNGAGKTTTMRMLLGLLAPSRGDAFVDGRSIRTRPEEIKGLFGLVSASAGLYQWLTPRESLSYFADLYRMPREAAEAQITHLGRVLELTTFLDRRCATLSSGQRQRVNLARALVHDPVIMLLDEPTRGLDVVGSRVVFDYINLLRDEGKSVLVSTHRLDEAERLCDRFALLQRGRIAHAGTLEDLRRQTGRAHLSEMYFPLLDREQDPVNSAPAPGVDDGSPGK